MAAYRGRLRETILPYWLTVSHDDEHGGYLLVDDSRVVGSPSAPGSPGATIRRAGREACRRPRPAFVDFLARTPSWFRRHRRVPDRRRTWLPIPRPPLPRSCSRRLLLDDGPSRDVGQRRESSLRPGVRHLRLRGVRARRRRRRGRAARVEAPSSGERAAARHAVRRLREHAAADGVRSRPTILEPGSTSSAGRAATRTSTGWKRSPSSTSTPAMTTYVDRCPRCST